VGVYLGTFRELCGIGGPFYVDLPHLKTAAKQSKIVTPLLNTFFREVDVGDLECSGDRGARSKCRKGLLICASLSAVCARLPASRGTVARAISPVFMISGILLRFIASSLGIAQVQT
jgi:hypothetical protein